MALLKWDIWAKSVLLNLKKLSFQKETSNGQLII